jgi:hypothetical protein
VNKKINTLLIKIKEIWKKSTLGYLYSQTSPRAWNLSEEKLFDLNKTVITLSSSALVLSFSAIQIGKPTLIKSLIGLTWGSFLLVIIIGIFLIFIKYVRSLSNEIIRVNINKGKYVKDEKYKGLSEELLLSKEFNFIYKTQSLMYILSILQLLFFTLSFLLLILTAYLAL